MSDVISISAALIEDAATSEVTGVTVSRVWDAVKAACDSNITLAQDGLKQLFETEEKTVLDNNPTLATRLAGMRKRKGSTGIRTLFPSYSSSKSVAMRFRAMFPGQNMGPLGKSECERMIREARKQVVTEPSITKQVTFSGASTTTQDIEDVLQSVLTGLHLGTITMSVYPDTALARLTQTLTEMDVIASKAA